MLRYNIRTGVKKIKTKTTAVFSAAGLGAAGLTMAAVMPLAAHAISPTFTSYTTYPFTSSELSNWAPDRATPSGGYDSVTFGGRSNTLEMRINSANRSTVDPFYYTEGLQRQIPGGASAVKADLYVDGSWTTNHTNVRAGIWGVGHDANGDISAYPIAEFTTAGDGGYVGWRTFNDALGGWINRPSVVYNQDSWNTVSIVYNNQNTTFDFTINGQAAGSSVATGSVNLGAVILNSYNYGTGNSNYAVHWSNFATGQTVTLTSKDQCMNNSWKTSFGTTFKNQGDCVSYVATHGKNQPNGH